MGAYTLEATTGRPMQEMTLDHLQTSLDKITARHLKLPNIVLAGNCNLPDIDWESVATKNARTQSEHNRAGVHQRFQAL